MQDQQDPLLPNKLAVLHAANSLILSLKFLDNIVSDDNITEYKNSMEKQLSMMLDYIKNNVDHTKIKTDLHKEENPLDFFNDIGLENPFS